MTTWGAADRRRALLRDVARTLLVVRNTADEQRASTLEQGIDAILARRARMLRELAEEA